MKTKIDSKTKRNIARHKRKETPRYDIETKDILAAEWNKANLSELDEDEDRGVGTATLSEDAANLYDEAPTTPPTKKGYRGYRRHKVQVSADAANERKNKSNSNSSGSGSDSDENDDIKPRSNKASSFKVKSMSSSNKNKKKMMKPVPIKTSNTKKDIKSDKSSKSDNKKKK
eukprot:491496_1